MSITLWKPEPDLLVHQALGKACEEASELASILARCLIQGLDKSEPASGKPNRQALLDEYELGRIEDSRHSPSFRIRVGHIRRLARALLNGEGKG